MLSFISSWAPTQAVLCGIKGEWSTEQSLCKLWAKKEVSPQKHYQRSLTQPLQHLISNSTKAAVFRHQCQGAWGFRFFGWGLCSFANYPLKTSRTVGCHVIWSILLQLGWGFKITWYHTRSSWGSRTRVPLQALPAGSQQQSQEVKSQLPRPRLPTEPQDCPPPPPAPHQKACKSPGLLVISRYHRPPRISLPEREK